MNITKKRLFNTPNGSKGSSGSLSLLTITWNDLKTQIEGDGAIKNFYNPIDRPNSGTDPLTVEVINTGGNAVNDNATILRTKDGVDYAHTCLYDFLNDVIIWEIDTKGNKFNYDNCVDFPFDTENIENNTFTKGIFTDFRGILKGNVFNVANAYEVDFYKSSSQIINNIVTNSNFSANTSSGQIINNVVEDGNFSALNSAANFYGNKVYGSLLAGNTDSWTFSGNQIEKDCSLILTNSSDIGDIIDNVLSNASVINIYGEIITIKGNTLTQTTITGLPDAGRCSYITLNNNNWVNQTVDVKTSNVENPIAINNTDKKYPNINYAQVADYTIDNNAIGLSDGNYYLEERPNSGTDQLTIKLIDGIVASEAFVKRTKLATFSFTVGDMTGKSGDLFLSIQNGTFAETLLDGLQSFDGGTQTSEEIASLIVGANINPNWTLTSNGAIVYAKGTFNYSPIDDDSYNFGCWFDDNIPENSIGSGAVTAGGYSSHACNYDFLNDFIVWELDSRGNKFNYDNCLNFPFDSQSSQLNDLSNGTSFNLLGAEFNLIESNQISTSTINLTNSNFEEFNANVINDSQILASGFSNSFNNNYINSSKIDLTSVVGEGVIRYNQISINNNTLTLIRPIQNKIINLETSNYENDFTIDGDNYISFDQTPSHNWSGKVICDASQLKGVYALDKTCKYGIITNCTINWTDLEDSIVVSKEVKAIWDLVHSNTEIELTSTGAYANWYNDGTKLIITNVVTL